MLGNLRKLLSNQAQTIRAAGSCALNMCGGTFLSPPLFSLVIDCAVVVAMGRADVYCEGRDENFGTLNCFFCTYLGTCP